ncbi:MAG: hypothetical protein JNJ61_25495 [Anaerolineae bacterium]|nr:hypothetical protein [Anaerolineae bacterium]
MNAGVNETVQFKAEEVSTEDKSILPNKRVNYVNGLVLTATDFRQEQTYHLERDYQHNRVLHESGVISGLRVTCGDPTGSDEPPPAVAADDAEPPSDISECDTSDVDDIAIRVSAGMGIDYRGRVFKVSKPMYAMLGEWIQANIKDRGENQNTVYVVARYRGVTEGTTIIAGKPCTPGNGNLAASRIRDDVDLFFTWAEPKSPLPEGTTLNEDGTPSDDETDALTGDFIVSEANSPILLATLTLTLDETVTPVKLDKVVVSMADRPTVPNLRDIDEAASAPRSEFATLSVMGPYTATLWVHHTPALVLPPALDLPSASEINLSLKVNDVAVTGGVAAVTGVNGLFTITTDEDIEANARLVLTFDMDELVRLNSGSKLEDFRYYVGADGGKLTVYTIAAPLPDVRPFVTYDLTETSGAKKALTLWFHAGEINIPTTLSAVKFERNGVESTAFTCLPQQGNSSNRIYIFTPTTAFEDGDQITIRFNSDEIALAGSSLHDLMVSEQFIFQGYDDTSKMISLHAIINIPEPPPEPPPPPDVIPFATFDLIAAGNTRAAIQELRVWVNTERTLTITKEDVIFRRDGGLVATNQYEWLPAGADVWVLRLTNPTDLFDDGELVALSFKASTIEVAGAGKLDAFMATQDFVYLGYDKESKQITQPTIIDLPAPDVLPFVAYGVERTPNSVDAALIIWVNTAVALTIDKADIQFERNGRVVTDFRWAKIPAADVSNQQVWRLVPEAPLVDGERVMLHFDASAINTTGANVRTLINLMDEGRFIYAGYDKDTQQISQPTIISLPPAPQLSMDDIVALIDERINALRPLPVFDEPGDVPLAANPEDVTAKTRSRRKR